MVKQLETSWNKRIAAISTRPKHQTLEVKLIDPALVEETYNITTGVTTVTADGVMRTFQARVIDVGWGATHENTVTTNASTVTTIRVQFPFNQNFGTVAAPIYRIRRGVMLKVLTSPDNPSLVERAFTCTSDIQGGAAASRTLEFSLDGDAAVPSV